MTEDPSSPHTVKAILRVNTTWKSNINQVGGWKEEAGTAAADILAILSRWETQRKMLFEMERNNVVSLYPAGMHSINRHMTKRIETSTRQQGDHRVVLHHNG